MAKQKKKKEEKPESKSEEKGKEKEEKKGKVKGGKEKDKDPLVDASFKAKGSRSEKLGALVAAAKKKYGHSVVCEASESEALIVPRVSTGLFGLDLKTNGGFPLRRVIMLYGPKSTAKTTLLLKGMGNAQKLCANCLKPGRFEEGAIELPDLETGEPREVTTQIIVECPCGSPKDFLALWIDAEGVWDPEWAQRHGVWPEKVILCRPSYGEQAFDLATAFINLGEINLITIDSLAAMAPEAEVETSMSQAHQGVSARMNNKFLRKIVMGMNLCFQKTGNTPSLWLVNQYREKIGVQYGSPDVVTGGKGQGFVTTLEIECKNAKGDFDKEQEENLTVGFAYLIKKSKVGVPMGRGTWKMCIADTEIFKVGDFMEHETVIEAGVDLGIIDHPNQAMYEWNGQKFRGISQLVLHFAENKEEYEYIKSEMLRMSLGIKAS